jgi:hypothetical protein
MGRWKVRVELPRSQQGVLVWIHEEMVTQTRAGVKVQVYGPTLPLCPGAGISPNTRRILWTPDRLESSMTLKADASEGGHYHATRA